jgi:hypothetical protein
MQETHASETTLTLSPFAFSAPISQMLCKGGYHPTVPFVLSTN